uniref:Protein shisa-5 n=1 Tax=Gallus gallus TaxID=9031 RepID=A0A8V1AF55_CHICK
MGFGTLVAIGVIVFAVVVITIILCLTCSCCCLYKACRRPQPVVTTTTATTVVHAPYPQQQGVPPSYPAAPYQGYQPVAIQPQPGMPVAPYPAQYPPPYPMQPPGPPAYHETLVLEHRTPSASPHTTLPTWILRSPPTERLWHHAPCSCSMLSWEAAIFCLSKVNVNSVSSLFLSAFSTSGRSCSFIPQVNTKRDCVQKGCSEVRTTITFLVQ